MELLSEIVQAIDVLKKSPDEIDVDNILRVLSLSHEVARDGLDRSQNADLYLRLKPQFDELSTELSQLKENAGAEAQRLAAAEKELQVYAEVLVELKNETKGMIELVHRYGEKRKRELQEHLATSDISDTLRIRREVRADFNDAWRNAKKDKLVLQSGTEVLDFKNFKTGV